VSKIRQYFYLGSGAIAGLLPLLVALGAIGGDKASAVTEILTQVGSLLGGAGAITAGVIVSKQRKDGTIDAEPVSAVERAINAIPVVVQEAAAANANLERLRQVATDAVGSIPVYGPEARAIIEGLPRF
jgi:hypothetical protein